MSLSVPGTGGALGVCRPILEIGGAEVLIGTTAIMFEVVEETNKNLVVQSSSRFVVGIAASDQSAPRWVPLFDLTGNGVQLVL